MNARTTYNTAPALIVLIPYRVKARCPDHPLVSYCMLSRLLSLSASLSAASEIRAIESFVREICCEKRATCCLALLCRRRSFPIWKDI